MLIRLVNIENCREVVGEYSTFGCKYSILKFSNGYVTGYINPYISDEVWQETTMSWDKLRKFLSNDGYVNAFEADSAVWTYQYACHSSPYNLYQMVLYGDTVIDNIKWKIVKDECFLGKTGKAFVRTEGKTVICKGFSEYGLFSMEEVTIYDFSLNIGDSILLAVDVGHPPVKKEITEIDSIVLNDGKKHKRILFDISSMIEGVGFADWHPFMSLLSLPTCASGPDLICCQVNKELLYMNPRFSDCNGTYVSNEKIVDVTHKASIAFADGQLRITFDDEALFDVAIYNMQGMALLQRKNNRNEMFANLGNLPQGVYVVRIYSGNYVYSEKIVK